LWIAIIAGIGVAAVVVGVLAASGTVGEWSALWHEVAKAGVQIVAVGVAGGALAAAWRGIAERREAAAATKDKIRAEFVELIDLYNGVKTVRRSLRSLGLDAKLHIDEQTYENQPETYFATQPGLDELKTVGLSVGLTQQQVDGFHEQMQTLNTLQLGYEAKARQFEQADLLEQDGKSVARTLESIESYLNHLVDLWEEHGWKVREGTQLHVISAWLQPLYRRDEFRRRFSKPMRSITKVINKHLFGAPPETDESPTEKSPTSAPLGAR
jgi:hypothetical protein